MTRPTHAPSAASAADAAQHRARITLWCAAITFVSGVAAVLAIGVAGLAASPPAELHGPVVRPRQQAPELSLGEPDGGPFHLRRATGRVVVLTFAETACLAACPNPLGKMKAVYQRLGPARGDRTLMVVVALDPARETLATLRERVGAADPRILGLRPTGEALSEALLAYGVPAPRAGADAPGPAATSALPGPCDCHSGGNDYFVIDKVGDLRLRFGAGAGVEAMAADLGVLVKEGDPPWRFPLFDRDGPLAE